MIYTGMDTETTGPDLWHGCRPFFVSAYDEDGHHAWEFDVDPLTREVIIPKEDWQSLRYYMQERRGKKHRKVFHNTKFDARALETIKIDFSKEWGKIEDTVIASHVLASGESHKLKELAAYYLDIDDDDQQELKIATNEARKIAKKLGWRIAGPRDPHFPGVKRAPKEGWWVFDTWLPRMVAKYEGYISGKCKIVNLRKDKFDIRIDRQSEWGNPFVIGRDGNREEVIQKYKRWFPDQKDLIRKLPQLDGKRLGCHCKPEDCHGDIIAEHLAKLAHPWWTVLKKYAITDAERTLLLWYVFQEALQEEGLTSIYHKRRNLLEVVYRMESNGISFNQDWVKEKRIDFGERMEFAEDTCLRLADYKLDNLDSHKQLQGIIFGKFKCRPIAKTKTGYSTKKEDLEKIMESVPKNSPPHRFLRNLMVFRKASKHIDYLDSYLDYSLPYRNDEESKWLILHPSFNITGTDDNSMSTTRFSGSNPNPQNISKQNLYNLRRVFGPLPGREWYAIDYSNIEMRIFAYCANDKKLIGAFERGESVHLIICEILYPKEWKECERKGISFKDRYEATLYQWVKNGNFSLIYGAGPHKADQTYHLKGAYKKIRKSLPKIDRFMEKKFNEAVKYGFITCLGGYRLQVPTDEPHKAVNYFVQGSAGWAMQLAMLRVDAYLQEYEDYHMHMTIHDELDFDFPIHRGNKLVARDCGRYMEQSGDDIGVPLTVEISQIKSNWQEKEKVSFSSAA